MPEVLRQAPRRAMSDPRMIGFVLVTLVVYLWLAIAGAGGWTAFAASPARVGALLVFVTAAIVACFSEAGMSPGRRHVDEPGWKVAVVTIGSLLFAWLPAYCDQRGIAVLDGETMRWIGLVVLTVGTVLRLWPVFVLGRRFSGFVAIQEGHTLETHGIYGRVRHPSYLGALLAMLGWALVFRSVAGIVIVVLAIPLLVSRMETEEAFLESEFGEEYRRYRARTWRLVPHVY